MEDRELRNEIAIFYPLSSILDPQSSILDPRSSILYRQSSYRLRSMDRLPATISFSSCVNAERAKT